DSPAYKQHLAEYERLQKELQQYVEADASGRGSPGVPHGDGWLIRRKESAARCGERAGGALAGGRARGMVRPRNNTGAYVLSSTKKQLEYWVGGRFSDTIWNPAARNAARSRRTG